MKRVRLWTLVALAVLAPVSSSAQSIALVDSFRSASLGRVMRMAVLKPVPYDSTKLYPVLYLLHGYSGDYLDWSTRTRIGEYTRSWPLLIVMPDAGNSWYVNSRTDSTARFEDYIINDLQQYVWAHFSVDTTRQAIAGLSMGGYGAVILGLRHPGQFRFVGSLSGALDVVRQLGAMKTSDWAKSIGPSVLAAFGEKETGPRGDYDPYLLSWSSRIRRLPYLYLTIGIQDGFPTFISAHRAFTDLLRSEKVEYEYHETPGGHNWQFWDREIRPLLQQMRAILEF